MKFTAVLTSNRRDIKLSTPKVLLLNVYSEGKLYRDHLWIDIVKRIDPFIPATGKVLIEFTAKKIIYESSEGKKRGLEKLRHIRAVV